MRKPCFRNADIIMKRLGYDKGEPCLFPVFFGAFWAFSSVFCRIVLKKRKKEALPIAVLPRMGLRRSHSVGNASNGIVSRQAEYVNRRMLPVTDADAQLDKGIKRKEEDA